MTIDQTLIDSNPFTIVYRGIISLLEGSTKWDSVHKRGNRVDMTQNKEQTLKDAVQPGDTPEFILVSNGIVEGSLHETSSSSRLVRQWAVLVTTGDLRLHKKLYPSEWANYVALSRWRNSMLALQYRNKSFVTCVNLASAIEGQIQNNQNRGIEGWSTSMFIDVTMHFQTSDLELDATQLGIP